MTTISSPMRYLLQLSYYYGVMIGVVSVGYDFNRNRVVHSKLLKIYATFASILSIGFTPLVVHAAIMHMQIFEKNQVLKYADGINIFVRFLVMVYTVTFRYKREEAFMVLSKEHIQLDKCFFTKFAVRPKLRQNFHLIFYFKYLSTFSHGLVLIFSMVEFTQVDQYNLVMIMMLMFLLNTQNMVHGVVFHYFCALWYSCLRFFMLNDKLLDVFESFKELQQYQPMLHDNSITLCQLSQLLAADIGEMSRVYLKMTGVLLQLNSAIKLQLLGVLVSYLFNNVAVGYFAVLFSHGDLQVTPSTFSLTMGVIGFILIFADLYIVYWISDAIELANCNTAKILRLFNAFKSLDVQFERNCEQFALQLSQQKLQINVAGMFNLNKQTSFALWGRTINMVIILIQSGYQARIRKYRQEHHLE